MITERLIYGGEQLLARLAKYSYKEIRDEFSIPSGNISCSFGLM